MIKRNITLAASLLTITALAVSACGSGSGGDTDTPEETSAGSAASSDVSTTETSDMAEGTIQLLTFNSAEQVQPVIDAFKIDHPNADIEVQTVPFGDLNAVVQSRVGGGDADVDVFLVDQPRLAAFAADGLLLDLTDRVDTSDAAVLPTALEATMYDGKLFALPVQTSTQLLFYNADALGAAGVEVPTTDPAQRKTWEQVVTDGQAAQEKGTEWGLLFEQGATPYQVLPLPESLGGGTGLTGPDALTPDLVNEGWTQAMTWWHDVHEEGVVPRGMGFGVTAETFAGGNAAYFLGGPWDLPAFAGGDLPFEWGVTAHPYFDGGDVVTPTGSFGWAVNPASDVPDLATELVKFVALTKEGSLAVAAGDPNIPTQTEALDEYLAQDIFGDGIGDLIRYELDNTARLRPISTGYIEYETIVGSALEDIRNGQDVSATLDKAQSDLTEALG